MAHRHSVYDSDSHFVIDPITRKMTNATPNKNALMQYDHNSERFTFELPRYIEGHDMSLCNRVEVHYTNSGTANGLETEEPQVIDDVHEVKDLQVSPTDQDIVICSWCISKQSTQLVGELSFLLRFACITEDNIEEYSWHTDEYKEIYIKKGKNNAPGVVEKSSDIIQQFIEETNSEIAENMEHLTSSVEQAQAAALDATESEAAAKTAQGIAENAAAQVVAIVAGNEAFTKYEADHRTAPPIVLSAEGKSILVQDSAERPLQGLRLYGKTTQRKTTGAQLLVPPYEGELTRHGVTFEVNSDGSIKISGTNPATDDVSCYFNLRSGELEPGQYSFMCYNQPSNCVTNIYYVGDVEAGTAKTFTATEGISYSIVFRVKAGATVNTTIYPMLNKGDSVLPWEPYSGGAPSPSPEYPQELVSVENPTVRVCGANLCNLPNMASDEINGITWIYQNGAVIANGTATAQSNVLPGKCPLDLLPGTYTVSGGDNGIYVIVLRQRGSEKTYITSKKGEPVSFEVISGDVLYLYAQVPNGTTVSNATVYPMVNAGETARAWEKYKEVYTADISYTLPGIPVSSGGNYTDENGQQWICDEVDFERGVYVQRVEKILITGEENWTEHASSRFYAQIRDTDTYGKQALLCSHVSYSNNSAAGYYGSVGSKGIYLNKNECYETLSRLIEFLTDNNFVFVVALATPTETALSAEAMAAYQALRTHKLTTTVLNDADCVMVLDYVADTKTYIDNKLAALVAANT